MPAPRHIKVTFSGVLGPVSAPVEIFVHTLSMSTPVAPGGTIALATLAQRARNFWTTFIAPEVSSQASLTRVRAAVVGAGGLVERGANGAYFQADSDGPVTGSGTPPSAGGIYQVSQAVSLTSARPGPSGRGRFFLPSPTGPVQPDGRMTVAVIDQRAQGMKAFIVNMNTDTAVIGVGQVVIASGGSIVKGLAPALYPVTGINLGRRLDIVRSRATAIDEDHTYRALVA